MSETYQRLREILLRYMSASMADATLLVACKRVGASPQDLGARHVEGVLAEISHGIRLFCPEERQAEMMLALAKLAE